MVNYQNKISEIIERYENVQTLMDFKAEEEI